MNARDFCFWIQGYMELTSSHPVPKKAWKLIMEHLELAKLNAGDSREEFEGVVEMLSGFTSIAGTEVPTDKQWARITDIVQGVFVKVTSDLDDEPEDSTDFSDGIKKALEEIQKTPPTNPPIPPYQPYPVAPWKRTVSDIPGPWPNTHTITCKATDEQVFCAQVPPVDIACSSLENAYDSQINVDGVGDMYSTGMNIAGR